MPQVILELDGVTKRFDHTCAADRLSLTVDRGELFTLLGPSGSGKSTILRIIAGLERPDAGRVLIEGRDVRGVPPWYRNVGMMFQQYAVFPHMNIAENVGYGLRVRKVPAQAARERVRALLALVGLSGMERKDVTVLSGGEQQRVALARALAFEPSLLLLDEPLGALDEKIRREMQTELKHIHLKTGTTFVYVTHDQEEALTMSDRIAVLNAGVCVQRGAPATIFQRPQTRFVAGFFRGCNVLDADLLGVEGERVCLRLGGQTVLAPHHGVPAAGRARVGVAIRAENLHLGERAHGEEVRLRATLQEVVYRGTNIDHVLATEDGQRLVATSTRRELAEVERPVLVGFRASDVILLHD